MATCLSALDIADDECHAATDALLTHYYGLRADGRVMELSADGRSRIPESLFDARKAGRRAGARRRGC